MNLANLRLAGLAGSILFLGFAAKAAPVYNLNAGTLTYENSYLGFGLSDAFTFTGPQPVSIQGSGATAVADYQLESLNVPFNVTLGLVIDDTGNESGPASANGIDYGDSQYLDMGAELTNSAPIILTAGNLTVSVPAIVSGGLHICTPDATCPSPNNPFNVSFGPLAGTLTVTFAQFNQGSTYTLTNAEFVATTPEPAAWVLALVGLCLLACRRFSGRRQAECLPHR